VGHPVRAGSGSGFHSGSLMSGAALLRLLERARNVEEIEELLVAAAVHPDGAGFTRARLLRLEPQSGQLSEVRHASGADPGATFTEWLQQARSGARANGGNGNRHGNGHGNGHGDGALEPAKLEGVCAAAWTRGGIALGQGASNGGPWPGPATGAVVLHRGTQPYALLVGEWESDEQAEHRPAALEGLRQLAAAGLEAVARGAETQRRALQINALCELERAILSALNLAEALRLVLNVGARGVGARGAALWLQGGRVLRLEVTHGMNGERETLGRALQPLAEQIAEGARVRVVEDASEEPLLSPATAAAVAPLALLPLAAYGRTLGVLAVYGRLAPADRGFEASDREFLELVADLAALAIDQARRFEQQRAGDQERRELKARARRQERMAAVGEMAVRLAEEVRNPLASIAAFARRAHRDLPATDPHREHLEIVIREAERVDRRLRESLEMATPEPPALKLESINTLVQDALKDYGETLVRRRIRLLKKLTPDLPQLLLDSQRVRRVLHNILERSLDLVAVGGRIRIESRKSGEFVVVEIAHDGLHRPGDLLDELFVPFRSARAGSAASGLTVAQQLVHEHGGEIRLRSDGEWNTVIAITLPVPDNQDRRRRGAERRETRRDRRSHKNGD
jgi:signal transduction histidine kinase